MMKYASILLLFLSTSACAEIVSGRVVAVADGDTLRVLDASNHQHIIRLSGIDAPEKRQPFGTRSKQHLSNLVFGKDVKADCVTTDRYGREVCKIIVGEVDANLEQIKTGMAWWYKTYAKDQTAADRALYSYAEQKARKESLGLWREPETIPPWEWRRAEKQRRK